MSRACTRVLVVMVVALTAPSTARADARVHFARAEALFAAGDYDGALAEYEATYAEMAPDSERFILIFDIAQCHERRHRYAEAIAAYERYLREGGDSRPDATTLRERVVRLEALVGVLSISSVSGQARVFIDGVPRGQSPYEARISPGWHEVRLERDDARSRPRRVFVAAASRVSLRLVLEPLHSAAPRLASIATFAVAGASAVTALALGTRAERLHDQLATREGEQAFLTYRDGERPPRLARGANAMFLAAGVLVVGASTALVIDVYARRRGTREHELTLTIGLGTLGVAAEF